jgi:hypothetical protein
VQPEYGERIVQCGDNIPLPRNIRREIYKFGKTQLPTTMQPGCDGRERYFTPSELLKHWTAGEYTGDQFETNCQRVGHIEFPISSSDCAQWGEQSPNHHIATIGVLGLLVSEIGSNHILHGNAHGLVHGNLNITDAARLPAKGHGSKSCARGAIQAC